MRAIVLLPLLLLSACAVRGETFSPRDETETSAGMPFTAPDLNAPTEQDRERSACPGGFAQGSRIDEYRDGSTNLFCD